MADHASNMGSSYGSNWGWWIVAIIAAIIITWWVAYAAYHNGGYYGGQVGYSQPTAAAPAGNTAPTGTGTNNTR